MQNFSECSRLIIYIHHHKITCFSKSDFFCNALEYSETWKVGQQKWSICPKSEASSINIALLSRTVVPKACVDKWKTLNASVHQIQVSIIDGLRWVLRWFWRAVRPFPAMDHREAFSIFRKLTSNYVWIRSQKATFPVQSQLNFQQKYNQYSKWVFGHFQTENSRCSVP